MTPALNKLKITKFFNFLKKNIKKISRFNSNILLKKTIVHTNSNNGQLLVDKASIEKWLIKHDIVKFELIEDKNYGYVVNVDQHVSLINKDLKALKVKFNVINGNFSCNDNQLISLKGCPHTVNGLFNCSYNNLNSLEGGPHTVNGVFDCSENHLVNLVGGPTFVNDTYYCDYNKINDLLGIPEKLTEGFYCRHNALKNIQNGPKYLSFAMDFTNNKLKIIDLKYLPKFLGDVYVSLKHNDALGDMQQISSSQSLLSFLEKQQLNNQINESEINKKKKIQKI